jgi:hypothetical protein
MVRTKRVRMMGKSRTTKETKQEEVCNDILTDALCTSLSISLVQCNLEGMYLWDAIESDKVERC